MSNEKPKRNLEVNLRSRALGICLGDEDLQVVGVRNQINQLQFKGWDHLVDFESRSDEEVSDFLEEAQARMGLKRSDAHLVLPRSHVMIQMAEFPPEAAGNLEEAMEYQLVNYFPVDTESYNFFPQVVSSGDQLKVMIVAVKKAYLGHAFGFIRRWDMKLAGLSLDTFALVNGLEKLEPERIRQKNTVIFRAFPKGLEMIGIREGKLVASHYIPLKGEDPFAPESTEDEDEETAATSTVMSPVLAAQQEEEAAKEAIIDFDELGASIEYGFSMARMEPDDVDHYLWAGLGQEEVREFLEEQAFIPFENWNDGTGEPLPPESLAGFGSAVCSVHDNVHLDLNMLPEKLRKRHKRLPVILGSVAALLLVLFFAVSEVKGFVELRERHDRLATRHADMQERMNAVAAAQGDYEAKKEQLEVFRTYSAQNMVLKMTHAMSQDLPDHTFLTSFIVKNGESVTIQGESDDPFEVQKILGRMNFLKNVKPSNAITSGRNRDGKRRFVFKADLALEALQ